jgi:hypothetical protein
MKKTTSRVSVRRNQGNTASPVVTFPTSPRSPVVSRTTVVRPTVRGNTVSIKRGTTDKAKR